MYVPVSSVTLYLRIFKHILACSKLLHHVSLQSIFSLLFREGYHNPQLSSENLIGLSRARRPHNAIFVNFEDEEVPTKPLDAAEQTWKRVCSNAVDHKADEELRKVHPYKLVISDMPIGSYRSGLCFQPGTGSQAKVCHVVCQVRTFNGRCQLMNLDFPPPLPLTYEAYAVPLHYSLSPTRVSSHTMFFCVDLNM